MRTVPAVTSPFTPPSGRLGTRARAIAVRRVLGIVLALNAAVVIVKIVVGVRTGALTVLGAALESVLDLLNNVVGMVAVTVAARAPDDDHPYGHEKFETLGALAIVGFLSISCFELLRVALSKLGTPEAPAQPSTLELVLLASTMVINAGVVVYERRRGRQLNSTLLMADAQHTGGDILVTALALGSLALTRIGLGQFDALIAVVVALLIAWSGYIVLRSSIPVLVDARAVDEKILHSLLEDIPGLKDIRRIKSRSAPSGLLFAELTVAVDGSRTVADAHATADRIEERIADKLGAAEVTVHVEPADP